MSETLHACAWFLGARLDVRELERGGVLAHHPITVRAGQHGYAMLFRFGAVALIGLDGVEQAETLRGLSGFVSDAFDKPESEVVDILIIPGEAERINPDGQLVLNDAALERLQVVAHVLAKSAVLEYFEQAAAGAFERVEQLVEQLRRGVDPRSGRGVRAEIGNALYILTRTVGRVEVTEKPDITWDRPDLERLYERLATEFELRDRDLALSRKLELVSRSAETYLDLVNHNQSLRVEWYIVALIVIEIVLGLFDKFF